MVVKNILLGFGNNLHEFKYSVQLSRAGENWNIGLNKFKHMLINQLCESAAAIMPKHEQSTWRKPGHPRVDPIQHLQGAKHLLYYTPSDRHCQVCGTSQNIKCTNFVYKACDSMLYLHPKHCFVMWHIKPYVSKRSYCTSSDGNLCIESLFSSFYYSNTGILCMSIFLTIWM